MEVAAAEWRCFDVITPRYEVNDAWEPTQEWLNTQFGADIDAWRVWIEHEGACRDPSTPCHDMPCITNRQFRAVMDRPLAVTAHGITPREAFDNLRWALA